MNFIGDYTQRQTGISSSNRKKKKNDLNSTYSAIIKDVNDNVTMNLFIDEDSKMEKIKLEIEVRQEYTKLQ